MVNKYRFNKKEKKYNKKCKKCVEKRCFNVTCNKKASYGIKNSKKYEYCSTHKPLNYVSVKHKLCLECEKRANFGKKGTKLAEYCDDHKLDDYVNVVSRTCLECGTRPNFGKKGTKLAEYCKNHKPDNYVNVNCKKCLKCDKQPNFGKKETKTAEYCSDHKPDDYVNVVNRTCLKCNKTPNFGKKGTELGEYCKDHKPDSYVDVKNKLCTYNNCEIIANYGFLFEQKIHCVSHKSVNEFLHNNPKCEECDEMPCYTDQKNNYPLRCEEHKLNDDVNIIEQKCKMCNLEFFLDDKQLCNSCSGYVNKIHHTKENRIRDVLTAHNFVFIHDKIIKDSCILNRPDFVINKGSLIIVIEVDENQHGSYACECEQARMINIFQSFVGVKTVFIRYNPDQYKDYNGKLQKSLAGREKRLIDVINKLALHEPEDILSVIYLYYDGDDGLNKVIKIDYENNFTFETSY
jgi:hypothetical protein